MDRDLLERYLAEGLSLRQISRLTDRDPSTVGYWIQKYGLIPNGRAKHAARGDLRREELEPLVESGATVAEMAQALDRSPSTIRYWLKKFGLWTKNGVGRRSGIRGRKLPVAVGVCRRHGETEFVLEGRGAYRCKRCRSEAVARRRRRIKKLLVEQAGGECVLCGYNKCISALEFHHLDPKSKSFGLAQHGATRALQEVRREAEKCLLVCANCHAEIEAGATMVPLELCNPIVPT
jgi:transposase-like protein